MAAAADFHAWFPSAVDTVLLDCDGVLWQGTATIPGAKEAVNAFRRHGKRVFFVTNNSTKTRAVCAHNLHHHGIDATEEEVVSSGHVLAHYLMEHGLVVGDHVYMIGEAGLEEELRKVGLVPLGGPSDNDKVLKPAEFSLAHLDRAVRAVVVGSDSRMNYYKLAMAASYLRYIDGCRFVATNGDRTLPIHDGLELPGGGTMVHMIEFTTQRTPEIVVGKPNKRMVDMVASKVDHFDRSRTVMVGDRIDTDIQFGNDAGVHTVLVLTGVSQRTEAESYAVGDARRPHYIVDSIATFLEALEPVSAASVEATTFAAVDQ